MDFHKNRGMEKVFGFLLVFFVNLSGIASANDSGKKVFVWEGVFSIHLIEKNDTYFSYRFEEYPKKPGARTFVLEISPSNEKFLGRSTSINLIADVVEKEKGVWEAEQVLLKLSSGTRRTPVWLLSRKGKVVNFENVSFLKMRVDDELYVR